MACEKNIYVNWYPVSNRTNNSQYIEKSDTYTIYKVLHLNLFFQVESRDFRNGWLKR